MPRKISLKTLITILLVIGLPGIQQTAEANAEYRAVHFDFFGESIDFQMKESAVIDFTAALSNASIRDFYERISTADYGPVFKALQNYREKNRPDDWLFYQLIRKTAQQLSPKSENYVRYTLYKWFLLSGSGYGAMLYISDKQVLFYVQSDENIYNIPSRMSRGRQWVCLNFHDYQKVDFDNTDFQEVDVPVAENTKGFTYRITHMPVFRPEEYLEKEIRFQYYNHEYEFRVKLNPQVQTIFANYPVVDYGYYFNIPLSSATYSSLIPLHRKNIKGLSVKSGIDYLMQFTRNAFEYKKDSEHFGKEKRLSPEETLLYGQSDCDDRAALFFYLVKELYDLPMIVLAYPTHVTVAVQLDKLGGQPIYYNGKKYYVCEPTPQKKDLKIGQLSPDLTNVPFEIAYAYTPRNK